MSPTPRVSISVHASPVQRALIDRAAAVLSQSRSDFVLQSSCARAQSVVLDQVFFALDDDSYARFEAALNAPDTPALGKLLARVPGWQKGEN